jgi:hypothetical protein
MRALSITQMASVPDLSLTKPAVLQALAQVSDKEKAQAYSACEWCNCATREGKLTFLFPSISFGLLQGIYKGSWLVNYSIGSGTQRLCKVWPSLRAGTRECCSSLASQNGGKDGIEGECGTLIKG